MINKIKSIGTILGISFSIFLLSFVVFAWSGPMSEPPESNINFIDLIDLPEIPKIHRSQSASGSVGCGGITLPGSITFYAEAGQQVTLMYTYTGRPNAWGHTYLDMRLNGSNVYSSSGEENATWRRSMNGMVNLTINSTGNHTFSLWFTCGSGTTSFSDGGGEWPNGGVVHTVIVGG